MDAPRPCGKSARLRPQVRYLLVSGDIQVSLTNTQHALSIRAFPFVCASRQHPYHGVSMRQRALLNSSACFQELYTCSLGTWHLRRHFILHALSDQLPITEGPQVLGVNPLGHVPSTRDLFSVRPVPLHLESASFDHPWKKIFRSTAYILAKPSYVYRPDMHRIRSFAVELACGHVYSLAMMSCPDTCQSLLSRSPTVSQPGC